jgi:hypothetical protein
MDVGEAARRWARTWQRAWPAGAVADIAALYREDAPYRSSALSDPQPGGARGYLREQFAAEQSVECTFADPIADGAKAAVQWWASWIESGETNTLAGTTVLHFDDDGYVVDHVDYWLQAPGRHAPYPGWGR